MSLLNVKHLQKIYSTRFSSQKVEALKDVSFDVEEGEYIAIMGESGSGQTILMVTHSSKAASYASRVLFIKDGQIFHQLYKGDMSNQEMYQAISDTLTMLLSGGQ